MMKQIIVKQMIVKVIVIAVLVAVFAPLGVTAGPSTFSDIKGHWAENNIMTAIETAMVSGYPDGTFKPNGTITRAEAAGMLSRVTKLSPEGVSEAFADLETHWSRDQVRELVALGFIDPTDYPGGFEPNVQVTRYELMKWIASGLAKSEADFARALIDTQETLLPTPESFKGGISEDQIPYIAVVRGTGIIAGFPDGTMRPDNNTTRAEVVVMLLSYVKVEGTDAKSYTALNELREVGLTGTNLLSISDYEYSVRDQQGTINDYTHIRNKPITARNNIYTGYVHRMIVIDVTDRKASGVYADLFGIEPYMDEGYILVVDETVEAHVDGVRGNMFANGIGQTFFAYSRISEELANEKGFVTIPLDYQDQFFAKGKVVRFWAKSSLDKSPRGIAMITDDGSITSIEWKR